MNVLASIISVGSFGLQTGQDLYVLDALAVLAVAERPQ